MWPEAGARMIGMTARVTLSCPKKLTSNTSRASCSEVSSIAPTKPQPALLTRTSIRPPSAFAAAPTPETIPSGFVTSSITALARPGESFSNSLICSGLRTVPTTTCPSARAPSASERPMPDETPVISQFLRMIVSDLTCPVGPKFRALAAARAYSRRQFCRDALRHHDRRYVGRDRGNVGQDRRVDDAQRFDPSHLSPGVDDSRGVGVRPHRNG